MDSHPDPMSVTDVDIQQVSTRFHRVRWIAVVAMFLALVAFVTYLEVSLTNQAHAVQSSCGFWKVLGTVQPVSTKASPRPGLALITLIVDSRNSYLGQGCVPALPPPSPTLLHWVAIYHLTVK